MNKTPRHNRCRVLKCSLVAGVLLLPAFSVLADQNCAAGTAAQQAAEAALNAEIEQINKRKTKDKFSALSMGIYRMTQLEEIHMNKRRNRGLGRENLFLFTSNNSRKKRK